MAQRLNKLQHNDTPEYYPTWNNENALSVPVQDNLQSQECENN